MFNDSVNDNATIALDIARSDIAGFDRAALGRFACDAEHLAIILTRARIEADNYDSKNAPHRAWKYVTGMVAYIESMLELDRRSDVYYEVCAEAKFWDDYIEMTPSSILHHTRLGIIASHDASYHDYYAVGIWDVNAIKVFIKYGIDAELAASTSTMVI